MAHKTTKTRSHKSHSRAEITEARREYDHIKKAYHKVGKAAFGKPSKSAIKKDYLTIKSAYRRAGNRLGKLTGVK